MKRLLVEPVGWSCSLAECPPGAFLFDGKHVGFKTEYRTQEGAMEVFNEGGEFFWGGGVDEEGRRAIVVQPVMFRWEDE